MDLIVIPFFDWKAGEQRGFRDRDTHFLEQLAKNSGEFRRILVIDRPTSLAELAVRRTVQWHVSGGTVAERGPGWRLTTMGGNIFVLDVLQPAFASPARLGRAWWVKAYRSGRLARLARRAMTSLNMADPVVVVHHPFGMALAKALPHHRLVFDAMDNYLKIPHFAAAAGPIAEAYREVSKHAAVVLAVSPECRESLFRDHPDVRVVRNGVDPEFFAGSAEPCRQQEAMDAPVVGFVGTLAERIDVELLEAVARRRPGWRFVLFGPVVRRELFHGILKLPNVSLVGEIHYRLVPSVLRGFDICMLPMSVGRYENDGDSIKLYEYVAAGRPVVTTPFAMADRLRAYVWVAENADCFANALDEIRNRGFQPGYPTDLLEGMTWSDKGAELIAAIRTAHTSRPRTF
jgi:glycosyltransferase involved in cell wall biosynthesis